jgi:hypothetical protein
MSEVMCGYCQKPAELVGGSVVYPYRPENADKQYWCCRDCKAWVLCKPNGQPAGKLANGELRRLKMELHKLFDPWWRGENMPRRAAYRWLSKRIGAKRDAHVGDYSPEECQLAIEVMRRDNERS